MNLTFNAVKSAIVEFAKAAGERIPMRIQNQTVPIRESYKYLGIILSNGKNYLAEQELAWDVKARERLRQMHAKSLWAFNKFEISKDPMEKYRSPGFDVCKC